MLLNQFFCICIFFIGCLCNNKRKIFSFLLALSLIFDIHGIRFLNIILSPIDIFFMLLVFRFIFANHQNNLKFKTNLTSFEIFYFINLLLLFLLLNIDYFLYDINNYNFILRQIFYVVFFIFLLSDLKNIDKNLFLKDLINQLTFLTLLIVFIQVSIPQFEYYVLSSTYQIEGIRVQGSDVGRALGPSREPAHLLPFALLSVILSRRLFHKNSLLISFSWFLIGYLSDSRALMIFIPIFYLFSDIRLNVLLFLKKLIVYIPLLLIVYFSIDRLDDAFSLYKDISVMQRFGSIIIIFLSYFDSIYSYYGLFNLNPETCINSKFYFGINNETCLVYTPMLNWTFNLMFSLPLFIVPILWTIILFQDSKLIILILSFLISGTFFYIYASPVVILYLLSSRVLGIKKIEKNY